MGGRSSKLKRKIADYAFLFLIAGIVVLLDQWTKSMVRANLNFGEIWPQGHWITPYARLVHIQNTGAAFGIFQNFGGVFTVLSVIVSIVIIYYFPRLPREDWLLRLALSLQLGGAVGNLIDRLNQGYVTDFVSLGEFAIFNVADACISIGVALLILDLWLRERKSADQKDKPGDSQQSATKEAAAQSLSEELKGE